MNDDRLGTVSLEGGRHVLRFERHLQHPPEKVWRAITESEHLQHWLPCDILGDRRAGASIRLPFWPAHVERYGLDTPVMPGEIHVWDPPSVFEWSWDTDRLRWELEPVGDGTRLCFTTWLGESGYGPADTAAGYHVCLDNLQTLLDTGTAPPLVDVDPSAWEERYADLVAGIP